MKRMILKRESLQKEARMMMNLKTLKKMIKKKRRRRTKRKRIKINLTTKMIVMTMMIMVEVVY
jgi:hypothetical protein